MQVKKFEAKTMKEALELVKIHMGPEAIIISAKDSHRGFGLMGDKSVEVTAAVSEETLRRMKIAESKIREDLRSKFHQIPASRQKEFINRVSDQSRAREVALATGPGGTVHAQHGSSQTRPPEYTRQRVAASQQSATQQNRTTAQPGAGNTQSRTRLPTEYTPSPMRHTRYVDIEDEQAPDTRSQAQVARDRVRQAAQRAVSATQQFESSARKTDEVHELQSQVRELKGLVEKFQSMPQISLSMHPGADLGLPFDLSSCFQKMTAQGVDPDLVAKWLRQAQKELEPETLKKPSMIDAWLVQHLLREIAIAPKPNDSRYHVFLGSTGQGKTTSLVKLAAHLVLKEKRTIAVVSLDTVKVGAADQLKIYAQILNVPFAVVRDPAEWAIAEEKLKGVQHILVDCPGFGLHSADELNWLKAMLPPAKGGRQMHYVQSILARNEESMELASRYQMLEPTDAIFTRLDETSGYGLMMNMQNRFRLPLHSFGLGVRIPEDYELATKERVVELLFKLAKIQKK